MTLGSRVLCGSLLLVQFAAAGTVPADIDAWMARTMKEFDVPGMALGIVRNGKLEFAKGYGVRRLGTAEAVDEHTVFGIASNTKAFTAAALAMLVDEGKVKWDDPVQKYLPSFAVYDPYVSRELTVRDLVSHRSGLGLGAGDLLFWPDTDVTREQVVAATRFIKPASSLRSRYAYNNLMFVVAGQVVAAASGKSWDDFVRERIFAPLGMAESSITSGGLKGNVAQPHSRGWRLEGELTVIPMTRDETWAAAAGIKSSVNDLSKWVAAQLGRGSAAGKTLWTEKQAEEMWSPQTVVPIKKAATKVLAEAAPKFSAYGLGWSLRDYKGRKLVMHGGALTGMVTTVVMVPEENLGIIVLTNQEEGGALSAAVYHVLDEALGLPKTDWIAAYRESHAETLREAKAEEAKLEAERAKDSRPSLTLSKYAGNYRDPWYGSVTVAEENGRLQVRFGRTPGMKGTLEHWQYDTFKVQWTDKTVPDALATFALDYRGRVEGFKMRPLSSLADFSFDYEDLDFKRVQEKAER